MLLVGGASRLSADKASRNLCCPIEINQEEELCSCADSMVKTFCFYKTRHVKLSGERIWRGTSGSKHSALIRGAAEKR